MRWLSLLLILENRKQGQKVAARPVTEGEKVRPNQDEHDPGNLQVPKSLKHPKRGLDQARVPPGYKGMFLGLGSGGECMLIAIPVSPCVKHQHVAT